MSYKEDELINDVENALLSQYDRELKIEDIEDENPIIDEIENDSLYLDEEDIIEDMYDYDKIDHTVSIVIDGIDAMSAKKVLEDNGIIVYDIIE